MVALGIGMLLFATTMKDMEEKLTVNDLYNSESHEEAHSVSGLKYNMRVANDFVLAEHDREAGLLVVTHQSQKMVMMMGFSLRWIIWMHRLANTGALCIILVEIIKDLVFTILSTQLMWRFALPFLSSTFSMNEMALSAVCCGLWIFGLGIPSESELKRRVEIEKPLRLDDEPYPFWGHREVPHQGAGLFAAAAASPDAAGGSPDVAGASPDAVGASPDAAGASPDAAGASPDAAGASPDAAGASPDPRETPATPVTPVAPEAH